ncbi:MAG: hypothetical protein ABI867_22700 [Kofleriaceae bacterium]
MWSYRCTALALVLAASPAHANEPKSRPNLTTARRVAAVAVAIVPGILVRGAGSWMVGEKRTAKRLAITAGIGLGAAVVGGLPLGLSGANPYSIEPGVPLLVAGTGALLTTWWADIAVAAGIDGGRARSAPPWSVELATLWLHDPYRERGLGRLTGTLELGRIGLAAATMIDAETDARDAELEVRTRLLGEPAGGGVVLDGSRLFIRTAGRVHRDDVDRVTLATAAIEIAGRLDLIHLDRVLEGTFAELSTGVGVERASYGGGTIHDHSSLLLATFAWGVYVGGFGEATILYDHRRDSLAGGGAASHTAGFVGAIGGSLDLRVAPHIAVRGQLEYGNAWVSTFAIRYCGGRP